MAAAAVAAFIGFPLITMAYRSAYPIVDTWVIPAAMTVLVDAAAILSVLAVWRGRERSVLSILTLVLSVLTALFTTMMVVGESIGP
jgi:cytochrome c biogenesis factor